MIPLIVYLAYVGPSRLDLLVRDLWASRPGRRLPPPALSVSEGQLLWAATVATMLFLVVGATRVWRARDDARSRLLLAIGVLLVSLYPAIFNRADNAHILPVAAVAIPLFSILVLIFVRERGRGRLTGLKFVALGALTLFVTLTFVHVAFSGLREDVRIVTGGDRGHRVSLTAGRSFLVDSSSTAHDLDRMLAVIGRIASPGDSLFVGPRDLRRTNYNDAFVYYLLPQLRPASFYLELNPGSANRVGSSLAEDLKQADLLLLTTRYDSWNEPNDSRKPGSPAPLGSGRGALLRGCEERHLHRAAAVPRESGLHGTPPRGGEKGRADDALRLRFGPARKVGAPVRRPSRRGAAAGATADRRSDRPMRGARSRRSALDPRLR